MNKKQLQLIVTWVMGILLFSCINIIPNSYCESDRVILASEVASLTLRLFYDSGSVRGYVIFRNYEAEMCAVKFIEPALLIIYDKNESQIWKKSLGLIDIKDFKPLELKNKDVVFAYEIKPFIFELAKDKEITVFFEWGRLRVSDKVSNFYSD